MTRSRLGPKALGLCAVLVGTFAFAGIAQAEPGAFWRISGVQAKGGELVEAQSEAAGITLLTELGGKFIDLKCPSLKLVGAKLIEPNGGITGKIDFSGCDFLSLKTPGGELVLQKSCEPSAEGVKGLIVTNQFTGLIRLHEPKAGTKEAVLEIRPTTGTLFASPKLGEECAFGEILKLGGVIFLKDCEGKLSTELVKHLLEVLKALTELTINEGTKASTVDGSFLAFLGSPNTGKTWSGIPK
jgi:hypothetical protein